MDKKTKKSSLNNRNTISYKEIGIAILCFISIGVFVLASFLAPYYLDFYGPESVAGFSGAKELVTNYEYEDFYYFLSLTFGLALVIIAFIQLGGLLRSVQQVKDNINAEFLLKIDERWGDAESLAAREIIHKFYLRHELEDGRSNNESYSDLCEKVGGDILNLRWDIERTNDFIFILNFLDLMETIGYLFSKGYMDVENIEDLCGYSVAFNYKIFEKYIQSKRERYGQNIDNFDKEKKYYYYFEELYRALKPPFNKNK